jgi:flagellar biosynthesis protein FlhF
MRLKRIEAATVAEAMRLLRQELGEAAIILHTRTVPGGGIAGRLARPRVEILGAVDEPEAASVAPRAADRRAEVALRLARFRAAAPGAPLSTGGATDTPPPAPDAGELAFAPPDWRRQGTRARRIAFVGPTGAGKTTTLAKVAARAHLDHGRRVRLATVDTYRIGAVPQLASYAEILGVPLEVAQTPEDLARSVERASEADLVFVDTTGRSPLGPGVESLAPYLEAAAADEVCLVVSATTRLTDSLRAAASFGRLGPNRLCVTKLDETDDHGHITLLGRSTGLPLAWLAGGQSVPDDLEEATPDRLAGLVAAGCAA